MAPRQAEWLEAEDDGGLRLLVKVIPGASRTGAAGLRDGRLLVRVAAPPEKGRANDALVAWLASALGLPRSAIVLLSGAADRRKSLRLPASAAAALRALAADPGP